MQSCSYLLIAFIFSVSRFLRYAIMTIHEGQGNGVLTGFMSNSSLNYGISCLL